MAIDAVVFDLDGTLVDSAPTIGAVLNGMRAELALPPLALADFRRWISLGADDLIRRTLEAQSGDVVDLVREFRVRYRALPTPSESLFPGVVETVATLARVGLPLAVCSNKPELLCRKVLNDVALASHFGAIVGGDTARLPKPARDPLDLALKSIGASAGRAVLVGDSTVDQAVALACGIRFVFFTTGYDDRVDRARAFACIDCIAELIKLVGLDLDTIPDHAGAIRS